MIGVFGGSPHPPEGNANLRPGIKHVLCFTGCDSACAAFSGLLDFRLSRTLGVLPGGNPDSNTLLSDMTTVVCLDDYHCLDRFGRKEKGVTALDPKAQDFDLMYEQVKDIRDNKPISKPIYNHVTGLLDPAETVKPPKVGHLLQVTLIMPCAVPCVGMMKWSLLPGMMCRLPVFQAASPFLLHAMPLSARQSLTELSACLLHRRASLRISQDCLWPADHGRGGPAPVLRRARARSV